MVVIGDVADNKIQRQTDLYSDGEKRRSKHIATRYFYVRNLQEQPQAVLECCPTEIMLALADILMNSLQHLATFEVLSDKSESLNYIVKEC